MWWVGPPATPDASFRSLRIPGLEAASLLVVALVVDVTMLAAHIALIRSLQRAVAGEEIAYGELAASDLWHGALGVFEILVFVR